MEPSCASRAKRAKRARESCPSLPFSVLEDASYPSLGGCRGLLSADGHEAVVALIESRSREVGLAGVCCRSMEFELTQFSDTTSYSRTTSAVLAADPSAVLVSRSARGTQLVQVLEKAAIPLTFLERRHFDEAEGQNILEEAIVVGLQQADYASKFAAMASFNALWRYVESGDVRLQACSCKVTFRVAGDICVVDSSTARLLELVSSSRRSLMSLFSCRTPQGKLRLRQSLLQPSANLSEIQQRQSGVEALLEDRLLDRVQQLLPGVGDLDLLLARLSAEPRQRGIQWYKAAVRTALRLRQALSALPLLAAAVGEAEPLGELRKAMSHSSFIKHLQELERVLDSTPHGGRSSSLAHAALMYAVKPNVSSLLDVARQTWTEALEQIHLLHRALALKYPELSLRLEFAEKKGWYLSHDGPAPELLQTMPRGSLQGRLSSSTRELNNENFKLRQAEGEILRRNVEVLAELFGKLQADSTHLHAAAQAVASLDVLCAFASYARATAAVKPRFTDDPKAPLAIKAGRHPTLERVLIESESHFEPMDFFVGESSRFQLITGHNGGGKSTYLQTLAQLVILAQSGCFVPAYSASLRVCSSIFTRIGSSDSIEASASSFSVEMKEASHILTSVSCDSLVLIDELGRGTAHADGLAICWAMCEILLDMEIRCLFATHYFELCRLQAKFDNLRNMHIEEMGSGGSQQRRFIVQHVSSLKALQLKAESHYGLKAALLNGISNDLVKRAEMMALKVDAALKLCEDDLDELDTARQLLALRKDTPMLPEILRELQKPLELLKTSTST